MVLFAKITPNNIEATCFAFLTGTLNFCNGVLAPMIGSKINDYFVGVTSSDLSNFYVLCIISIVTSILPFFILWMIPTKDDVKRNQE